MALMNVLASFIENIDRRPRSCLAATDHRWAVSACEHTSCPRVFRNHEPWEGSGRCYRSGVSAHLRHRANLCGCTLQKSAPSQGHFPPSLRAYRQRQRAILCHVDERAMVINAAISK